MLRCSPSRIHLTLSDLDGLEDRLQAYRPGRLPHPRASNIHLSPGPAHPTILSFVSADQNVGRRRATSSSSDVVVWDDSNDDKEEDAAANTLDGSTDDIWTTARDIQHSPVNHSTLHQDAVRVLEDVAEHRRSPALSSPRRQIDSFYEDRRELRQLEHEIAEYSPASHLDGAEESELNSLAPVTPFAARVNDSHRPPRTATRALSSARARRRHARSSEDPGFYHEGIRPFSTQSQMWLNPVPRLVLPTETSSASLNSSFNPSAPVFVPRTRFGTVAGPSTDGGESTVYERPWRSLDHTSSTSNLRLRSSGELNVEPPFTSRNRPARQTIHNEQLQPHQRQRSGTSDQNTAFPLPSPNLERYPLLRPTTSLASQRRTSTLNLSATSAFDRPPSSAVFINTDESIPSSESHRPQDYHVRHAVVPHHDDRMLGTASNLSPIMRSISPALSSSSRSTPNLLNSPLHPAETRSRGSSLSWRGSRHQTPAGATHRISSIPVNVSENFTRSLHPVASRQSSREGLDAAAEFLRMRNSPLDDLTERLSRLAAGRQRSVGRSWERLVPPGSGRVSLLMGDPFRQESGLGPGVGALSPVTMDDGLTARHVERGKRRNVETEGDPVALAMALPPSSPFASSSQTFPSTPPAPSTSSPRSPLAQRSPPKPFRSPSPLIKRKPVPPSSPDVHATPKVKVYDDARPPHTQPQTPADISHHFSRHARTRSETASQQSPRVIGRATMTSPARAPPIPERKPYRNTYPPAPDVDIANGGASASTVQVTASRTIVRAQTQSSNENDAESEVEGALRRLEQDHRTWLARREQGGDLDVTPPREGRFERFVG